MVFNKNKVLNPCKYCGKTNHPKKSCFKWRHDLAKVKKKSSKKYSVSPCTYYVQPSHFCFSVECIMDSNASNHMTGLDFLLNSYDTKKHTQHKVSISDSNHLSLLGSGNVIVPNGTLEHVFHVQRMPINLLSIYHACWEGYQF